MFTWESQQNMYELICVPAFTCQCSYMLRLIYVTYFIIAT